MARIFYALSGDSRGHLSRAEAVVSRMPEHEFVFGGGGTVLELRDKGYEVVELPMLRTIMRADNRCDLWASVGHIAGVALRGRQTIRALGRFLASWGPDLVISDYDIFSQLAAKGQGIRCVSLSHMHVVSHCRYERLPLMRLNGMATRAWIRTVMSHCSDYVVSSFYPLPPENEKTTVIVPPVLRPEVTAVTGRQKEHVLVYLPYCAPEFISDILGRADGEYVAYTKQEVPPAKNVTFRRFDRSRFLQDLADCRYVICSAGHSLLSEALYFGKPVLCVPTKGLFEQYLNAHHLSRLGYGSYVMDPAMLPGATADFVRQLDAMRLAISQMEPWGNDRVVQALETYL